MNKITEERFFEIREDKILKFLMSSSAKERHQLVNEWNWRGFGIKELKWIVSSPDTDKATALQMYWKSYPWNNAKIYSDRNEVQWYDIELFDFIEAIEKNYVSGFYKNQTFGFDPKKDMFGYISIAEEDWTAIPNYLSENGKIKRDIPAIMFEKLNGEKIPHTNDWVEGIPPHIHNELSELQGMIEHNP